MNNRIAIIFIFSLTACINPSSSQNYASSAPTGTLFTDPIRKALGLWGRLLNRMAQTGPPTDEQLHLENANEREVEEFDFPKNQNRFFGGDRFSPSIQNNGGSGVFGNLLGGNANGNTAGLLRGGGGYKGGIIDERKLLELLPRIREPDTTTTTTTTTTTATTTTTTTTPNPETTTSTIAETTTVTKTESLSTTVIPSESDHLHDLETSTKPSTKASEIHKEKRKNRRKNRKNTRKVTQTVLSTTTAYENATECTNSTKNDEKINSLQRETEEMIAEIDNVLADDKNWIISERNLTKKNKKIRGLFGKQKPQNKPKVSDDGDELENGSGEEAENTNNSDSTKAKTFIAPRQNTSLTHSPDKKKAKNYEINGYEGLEDNEEDDDDDDEYYESSEVLQYRDSKTEKAEGTEPGKKLKTPSKHKSDSGKSRQSIGIPEAEEEDLSGNFTSLQLDPSAIAAVAAGASASDSILNPISIGSVLDPASAVVPVRYASSIIDGIGPLILPLLGYSRRVMTAGLSPARTEGVSIYRPKQQQNYEPVNSFGAERSLAQINNQKIPKLERQHYDQAASNVRYSQKQFAAPIVKNNEGERTQVVQPRLKNQRMQNTIVHNSPQNGQLSSSDVRVSAQNLESSHLRHVMTPELAQAPAPSLKNRVVNAETDSKADMFDQNIHGLRARFMPDPPSTRTPTPTVFASDAIRQALSNILHQPRIVPPTTQEVAEGAFRQIFDQDARESPYQSIQSYRDINLVPSKDRLYQENRPRQIQTSAQRNPNDPGYDQGRSNVESNFYEDSGIMVNSGSPQISTLSQPEVLTFDGGALSPSSGFGGGRRPDVPFEEVSRSGGFYTK